MVSPSWTRRSNRNARTARPLTRPDASASVTVPRSWVPAGSTVRPDTVTPFAIDPLIGSSTLLVFDASVLSSLTLSDVPEGIVTSRNTGAGGGGGGSGARGAAAGAAAGVDAGAADAGGADAAADGDAVGAAAGGVAEVAAGGALAGSAGFASAGCA